MTRKHAAKPPREPARAHPSQQARRRRVAAEKLARSARILVCDCDAGAKPSVGDMVRGFGYEVVANHALADTLREATVAEFDVVVASVPVLDDERLRLLQLLRRARPHLALVLVTADSSLQGRARGQQVGPYYVAVRPFEPEGLRTALVGAVARSLERS